MSVRLLVADPDDPGAEARTVGVELQLLATAPGGEDITVSFRPNRSDDLYPAAKEGGRQAYRILFGEGIVRSQLVTRYQLSGAPVNVAGRSAELPFALAVLLQVYGKRNRDTVDSDAFPEVAATGVLDSDGTVRRVRHLPAKIRAALAAFGAAPFMLFFPAENLADVDAVAVAKRHPNVRLQPIGHLDEALKCLGIVLERVYLRNPFRGLEHFDYEHHAIFFGRDAEVRGLVQQLLRREAAGRPGVLVEGPSGSGKSSFLRAGVLPALVNPRDQFQGGRDAFRMRPISADVRHAIWRPGLMSYGVNEAGVARSIRECWASLGLWPDAWRGGQDETFTQLAQRRRSYWPSAVRFVWMVDQFEEIFALGLDAHLVDALGGFLAELQADGVWTLASIRADALSQLKQHDTLRAVFGADEGQYYLGSLRGVALDDVIGLPAKAGDLRFGMTPDGKRLDQLLREEAYRDEENLPLLQFTLNELYLRRSGRELTYAAYQDLGGLAGSVAGKAAALLRADSSSSGRSIRRLFRHLVSVDETGRATRRYASLADIARDPTQQTLVMQLVEARLCVTDQRDGDSVVAFAHDSLLRTLPVFTEWLKEEGALLQTRELAQRDARLWQQHGEANAWLAPADKLSAFKTLETAEIALPPEVGRFIDRSQHQARQAMRIKQAAVVAIAVLAMAASISAWVASSQKREAQRQAAAARESQLQLLTEAAAERLKDGDLIFARGIVLEVLKQRLASRALDPVAMSVLQEIRAIDPAVTIMTGHTSAVRYVAYSPDGSRILTASLDGTARIWDARTGVQLHLLNVHPHVPGTPAYYDIVKTAVYSPDGTRILTADAGGVIREWDPHTGAAARIISEHLKDLQSAQYSRDGARIVSAAGSTVQIWNGQTGALLAHFTGPDEGVNAAVFSSDGSRVAAASRDGSVQVWDARSGRQMLLLTEHQGQVMSAMYSPDGRTILTSSRDSTARIWDARTGAPLKVLPAGGAAHAQVWFATYSPDGKTIATAGTDQTVRLWDAATGTQLRFLSGHVALVGSIAFSSDGKHLASGGWDLTVRTWNLKEGSDAALVIPAESTWVQFSPDGKRLLTASTDGTARIWDAYTGRPIASVSDPDGTRRAAYSPDGTRFLTTPRNKGVRVWDAVSGARVLSIPPPINEIDVMSAVYSADGSRILASFEDFTLGIRDARTGADIITSKAVHRDFITSAVYSPDAAHIVTASVDGTARVWDAKTLTQLLVLPHKDSPSEAVYSPDGQLIVTGTADSFAHVWDARTGIELRVLIGHHAQVTTVAFSPDGSLVATGSRDRTARIWEARSGMPLAVLVGHNGMLSHLSYSPDGARIATAAAGTARIWDARVPADSLSQVLWQLAVEADPLTDVQSTELGIPSTLTFLANSALEARDRTARDRTAGDHSSSLSCSQRAGAYYDPERLTPGIKESSIIPDYALSACGDAARSDHSGQISYQTGRARLAAGDFQGARREFEYALSKGYRAARVDLGLLLIDPSANMLDPDRATTLLEKAWNSGLPIAGFELGALYEHGIPQHRDGSPFGFRPDDAKAWRWYQDAAKLHEPNSLARLAEGAERKALAATPDNAEVLFLQAFTLYARAAERARAQGWPDDVWRNWRYRRASLARMLAADDKMTDVARAFQKVLGEPAS
jgi:WD40 repeat protein